MTFTVRPASDGGWHAFVSDPRLLLVAPHDDAFVTAAWAVIGAENGFQSALDLLTSRGLAATPPFVLIEWAPGATARVILRGEIALTVTDASGEQQLTAAGVSTWVERTLPGVTAIALSVPGATALGSAQLPLDRGVSIVAGIASEGAASVVPSSAVPVSVVPVSVVPAQAVPVAVEPQAPAPVPSSTLEPDVEATVREAPETPEAEPEPVEIGTPPAASAASSPESYDYLFGDTMYRNVADAAVREPEADEALESTAVGEAGVDAGGDAVVDDTLHDGETVVLSEIARTRGRRKPKAETGSDAGSVAPQPVPEPAKVVLVLAPTGAREPLNQPVLMGRSPSVSKVSAGQVPRLVTIGTVDQDISRNHAQFSLEGGTVVITDLHSRNGTTIALPGKSAQKLRPGEPTSVIVGTVVDFGGGVTVKVEEES